VKNKSSEAERSEKGETTEKVDHEKENATKTNQKSHPRGFRPIQNPGKLLKTMKFKHLPQKCRQLLPF